MLRVMRDDNAPDSLCDRMTRSAAKFMHLTLPSIAADDESGDAESVPPASACAEASADKPADAGGEQPC